MGSLHRRRLTADNHPLLPLLLTLLVTARCSLAQSPPSNSNNGPPYFNNANFNPSMAIVIVVLISAFFFLGFFSIYIRQCAGARNVAGRSIRGGNTAGNTGRSRRQRGLDPEVLASFPTLVYSDVKAHKIGKDSLECAVCLSEFQDDETLRLLPKCDHVFHPDCIDAWLAAHVTCPVCRSNLTDLPPAGPTADPPASENVEPAHEPPVEHLVVEVEDDHRQQPEHEEEEEERKTEIDNLERFVNMKRARSRARPPAARFPRSHSTGHSLVLPGENLDRFTLRLPENIRKEIVEKAEMLQRTKSLVVFPSEESSRRGYRGGGDGSGRGARSIRLGRSDRWGSVLLRTLSTKMPNWGRRGGGDVDGSTSARGGGGFSRRGDSIRGGEGSSVSKAAGGFFRRGDSMKGEGSARRFNAVIAPFDCYGGGGAKENSLEARDSDSQSSTAALNRV